MKIKNHFFKPLSPATNILHLCTVTCMRRIKGSNTEKAVKHHPNTVVRSITREAKSTIAIGQAPRKNNCVRFAIEIPREDQGILSMK